MACFWQLPTQCPLENLRSRKSSIFSSIPSLSAAPPQCPLENLRVSLRFPRFRRLPTQCPLENLRFSRCGLSPYKTHGYLSAMNKFLRKIPVGFALLIAYHSIPLNRFYDKLWAVLLSSIRWYFFIVILSVPAVPSASVSSGSGFPGTGA